MRNTIPIVRHLDDIDDLKSFGRDGGLILGQEQKAKEIADVLFDEIKKDKKKALLIVTSPRNRAIQTANLVSQEIKNRQGDIKIRTIEENNFREIDQGKFILPEGYQPGDKYEGLMLAGKIFFQEVFGADCGGKDNYNYKYGDSLIENNIIKYPELNNFFLEPGESYKDVLIRVYSQIIKASQSVSRYQYNTKISVFTHGQPSQIIKDLVEVSNLIKNEKFLFKTGELPRICWEQYKKRNDKKRDLGRVDLIPIDGLFDNELIFKLQSEIDFLKEL